MQGEIKIARRRGRPRQDIENRVHLCECGNSYFSYAALWSHQKKKHRSDRSTKDEKSEDGAKSQQSKEEPFKRKRSRGRPKQNSVKVVQDSNAQVLENEEASLTKFCDLLMKEDKVNVNLRLGLKEIYMKEQLFEYFKEYRSEEKQTNYNECEDLFEDSLLNIQCEFIVDVSNTVKLNFHRDLVFVFMVIIHRGILEKNKENKLCLFEASTVKELGRYSNYIYLNIFKEMRRKDPLIFLDTFKQQTFGKLMELFYGWISYKKYSGLTVLTKIDYFR